MTEKVEVERENLKELLTIIESNIKLLEEIPSMQDEDRLSEVSQIIGGELEAILTSMNKIEKDNQQIRDMVNDLSHNTEQKSSTFEDLEQHVLGD